MNLVTCWVRTLFIFINSYTLTLKKCTDFIDKKVVLLLLQ